MHSYQSIKLYLLHIFENNESFVVINKEFICDLFKK
jgi:hypothetical protein